MSCEQLRAKKITTCKGNIKSIDTQTVQFSPVMDRPNNKETNLWVSSDKKLYFGSQLVKTVAGVADASVDLQDVYDNSADGETQLATNKPYIIKAVDTTEIVNIDGDAKEVNFTGNVLVNNVNVEGQVINISQEIANLQNTKYDKTGGVLTGDLIHNGNDVQLQGTGAIQLQNQGTIQIQNQGAVQIQPTGALTLKGHGVIGEVNMGNHKIINVATPTDPFDAATKSYVDVNIPSSLTDLERKTQNIESVIENEIMILKGRIQLDDNDTIGNSIYISPDEHVLVIARGAGNNFELNHENSRGVIRMTDGIELNTNLAYVTDGSGIISFNPVQNVFSITKNATAGASLTVEDTRTVVRSNQKIESEQDIAVVSAGNPDIAVQIFPTTVLLQNGTSQLTLRSSIIRTTTNLTLDAPKVECLNDVIAPNQIGVPLCFGGSAVNNVYLVFNGVADENLTQTIPEIKHTAVSPINGVCRQITFIKGSEVGTSTFEITIGVTTHTFDITGRKGVVTIPVVDVAVSTEITIRKTANSDAGQLNMIVYVAPTSN